MSKVQLCVCEAVTVLYQSVRWVCMCGYRTQDSLHIQIPSLAAWLFTKLLLCWRARCNDLTCCLKVYTSLPKEVLYVPIEHLKYIFCPFLREIVFIVFNSQILC